MKKARQYSEVLKELEDTLAKMNRGEVPIDELEETVKQAAEKIRYLRGILRSTQTVVTKILKEVEEESLEENG
ncbi:MAG: exodeoxyribonuclease VII small subunit [Desulfomonilia bacterium]|mgnify:FL=1|jgi:exodeoxyribonuclease VII small subunit|uniref:Exodeoxyribonuclease 7 small subunit n=1 Tax=anaerobic digester metagenome TaxID=1263854 RepID=A0A485M268_9ZZZZ|nr:exodeoxyribonuclease VII small subunit [Pseudomonadota bacterium]HON38650.1 exodeoxyribonuclease VII small subunit [Deltaproteobacteria bacterium]HRS55954.1 exodeoxyribonuclease VII small subunit [Desulfomonilia bacterium]HPD21858.1 exodeoxyribonuclease VII small subunit [Deltaproteobacteria bacterium]HPX17883.1 exodeoxyribonuclease VII small subunit [Deltaproteobacteria bacterium]